MMEAARTSETLVNFYQTTRRYNPEDSNLHTHRRENLKSYDNVKSPMSSILLVTVRAERLTALTHLFFFWKQFFFRTHETSFHEFPIGKCLPSCAISLATWKLARTTAKSSFTRDLNIFYWSKRALCKLLDLSVLVWPLNTSYFSLWRTS
jgi:hypothetical protein